MLHIIKPVVISNITNPQNEARQNSPRNNAKDPTVDVKFMNASSGEDSFVNSSNYIP